MLENKTFKDSKGTKGRTFLSKTKIDLTSRNLPKGLVIGFEPNDAKTLRLTIPAGIIKIRPKYFQGPWCIKITNNNAISLAHWILDNCK